MCDKEFRSLAGPIDFLGAIMGKKFSRRNTPRKFSEAVQLLRLAGAVGIEPTTSPV
jgi:hypothetical protein